MAEPPRRGGLFDRLADTAYERFDERGLVLVFMGVALLHSLIMAVMSIPLMVAYAEFSVLQAIAAIAGCGILSVGALLVTRQIVVPEVRPVFAWMDHKSEETASAAWNAATRFVPRAVSVGIVAFSVFFLPIAFYIRAVVDAPWRELPAFILTLELLVSVPAAMDYFAFQRLMVPLYRDLAGYLPADFSPDARATSLRWRLIAVIAIVTIFTAVAVAGITRVDAGPAGRMALAIGIAAIGTLALGLLPISYLARSVVSPIEALEAAAARIERGDLDARVPLTGADEMGRLTRGFNRMVQGLEERAALQSALGMYIDPQIAERVLAEGERLVGEEAEVTVMFVDIIGFTSRAEHAPPEDVVTELNEFFDVVIPAIERNGGHANKLLGDGLMAVFGVPNRLDDHGDRALAAAREIKRGLAQRYRGALRVGIGLNSGSVVVGSMGGGGKLDFTIIGDVVNVAARVEAQTRRTGDVILLTDTTKRLLSDGSVLHPRGSHALRGRAGEVTLWAPDDDEA